MISTSSSSSTSSGSGISGTSSAFSTASDPDGQPISIRIADEIAAVSCSAAGDTPIDPSITRRLIGRFAHAARRDRVQAVVVAYESGFVRPDAP